MAIVTINDMRNLVIIFAISKCEFYNFEKENIKYAHIQIKIVLFLTTWHYNYDLTNNFFM